jgi:excisionase family DNA binding protein
MVLYFHVYSTVCDSLQEVKKKGAKMAISISVKTAAVECGLSERTIHSAIQRGELKVLRVGRRVLITPESLRNYLNGKSKRSKALSRE